MSNNLKNCDNFSENISILVHNTRGSAGIISSSTELLKRESKSISVNRYIEMIRRQTQKILFEIEILRELHTERRKLNCKKMDVIDFIFDLALDCNISLKIDESGITKNIKMVFDPTLLKTILHSILLPPTPVKNTFFCKFEKTENQILLSFPWENKFMELNKFKWVKTVLDKYFGSINFSNNICTLALPVDYECISNNTNI